METLEERCQIALEWAQEESDFFLDLDTKTPESVIPDHLKGNSIDPFIVANLLADVSFKLYILYNTKTEEDVQKLVAYAELLEAFKKFSPKPILKTHFRTVIFQLKMAYPVLEKDTVIHEIRDFFWAILNKDSEHCNPLTLFSLSMRLCNLLAENGVAMSQCMKVLQAQKERSIESHPDWNKIEPIFKAYAKELETNPVAKFGVYFYGKQADRLEGILREIGEWSKANTDKETNYVESESKVSERNYKRWKANFDRWYKRNYKGGKEQQLISIFKQSFWKKTAASEIMLSLQKQLHIPEEGVTLTDFEEFRSFSVELSRKLQGNKQEN